MAGWTNRGKKLTLQWAYQRVSMPSALYVALFTSAAAPTPDTLTFSELTEIPAGNGYTTGGFALAPNATDFDTLTQDDAANKAQLFVKDVSWLASGGPLPASGSGARYVALTTDEVTVAARQVVAWWDLISNRSVVVGQILALQDLELDLTE